MNSTPINFLDIDNLEEVIVEVDHSDFSEKETEITGLVSFLHQDYIKYYDDFKIHKFDLLVWQKYTPKIVVENVITIYRIVPWNDNFNYLTEIKPFSNVKLSVQLNRKENSAIATSGQLIYNENLFASQKEKYNPLLKVFGEIKHDYDNNYVSAVYTNGNTTKFSFYSSKKCPVSKLALKTYEHLFATNNLTTLLEQKAFNELFELKGKGWFKEENYTVSNFKNDFKKGHILQLFIKEKTYSIWYEDEAIFKERIVFDGTFEKGITKTGLFLSFAPGNYRKSFLLNKQRETLTIEPFGTLKLDYQKLFFQGKWQNIPISFLVENKKISPIAIETAKQVLNNLEEWREKAFKYVIDVYLPIKNESWLNDDERPLDKRKFITLLGGFSISFEEENNQGWFSFSFETKPILFSYHKIYVTGNLSEGFIESGF